MIHTLRHRAPAHLGQEGVEAEDELTVTLEKLLHLDDDSRSVDPAHADRTKGIRSGQPGRGPPCTERGADVRTASYKYARML